MRERFIFKETNVLIIADESEYVEAAKDEILRQRRHLEAFIREDPLFLVTLERYELFEGAVGAGNRAAHDKGGGEV